jgi:pseudaminic acid biosynthesis-associated methylase
VIARTGKLGSMIEFGANRGLNLRALNHIFPDTKLSAIEINATAAQALRDWGQTTVYEGSILEFESDLQWDMTLIKGVLNHINPERLQDVYQRLYERSKRFVCIAEYFNPTPVEVSYRGHAGKLFKRDFAGEMLDKYPDLRLVDYGFFYRRDPAFPTDDWNWFLMEKA